MNPQRSDLLPNLRATLGLVSAGLLGVGLGVGIAAGIYRDGAALEAIPQASAMELAVAPAATPDPVRNDVDAPARADVAAIVSVGATVPVTPPEAIAPDPVQNDVAPSAPAFELAGTGSAVAALADPHPTLPPAAPLDAIAPANTADPVPDDAASASPVDPAATESAGAAVPDPGETPAPPPVLVSLFRPAAPEEDLKPVARVVEVPNECLVADICIDDYLWAFYERTPKVDTNRIKQRVKALVRKKGKTRTVTRTVTRYVVADFTWKDPIAAQRAGMPLKDYVIGGMDRRFKLKLYYALRAMDEAGFMPGITSAFRDDYRQGIASGNKAASDSSYHGGSRRGGYGHGLAADLVSVKGETRLQRFASTVEMWKWIDEREKELGIGRPYLNRDPPHVGPIDGKEYADKRGRARAKLLGRTKNARHPVAGNPGATKPEAKAAVKVGSI